MFVMCMFMLHTCFVSVSVYRSVLYVYISFMLNKAICEIIRGSRQAHITYHNKRDSNLIAIRLQHTSLTLQHVNFIKCTCYYNDKFLTNALTWACWAHLKYLFSLFREENMQKFPFMFSGKTTVQTELEANKQTSPIHYAARFIVFYQILTSLKQSQ